LYIKCLNDENLVRTLNFKVLAKYAILFLNKQQIISKFAKEKCSMIILSKY